MLTDNSFEIKPSSPVGTASSTFLLDVNKMMEGVLWANHDVIL